MSKERKSVLEYAGIYRIGSHLSIVILPAVTNREIPSGEKISPGTKVGHLDIVRNVKNIEGRELMIGVVSDLLTLIDRIKEGSFPEDINIFMGSSHLCGMRIVEGLGFVT